MIETTGPEIAAQQAAPPTASPVSAAPLTASRRLANFLAGGAVRLYRRARLLSLAALVAAIPAAMSAGPADALTLRFHFEDRGRHYHAPHQQYHHGCRTGASGAQCRARQAERGMQRALFTALNHASLRQSVAIRGRTGRLYGALAVVAEGSNGRAYCRRIVGQMQVNRRNRLIDSTYCRTASTQWLQVDPRQRRLLGPGW